LFLSDKTIEPNSRELKLLCNDFQASQVKTTQRKQLRS